MRTLLCLCGAALAAFSCSSEKAADSPSPTPRLPLSVEVTSGSYTAAPGDNNPDPAGRNYPIELSEGDAIGLYVVHADGSIAGPEKLTLASDGSWPTTLKHAEGDRYFACLPWQEVFTAEVNAAATDDKSFFAPLIESWNPATDQHDPQNGFKHSALLTATGRVTTSDSEATLQLQFTPRMAMVAIVLPSTTYHFNNTPAIPDYVIPASNPVFDGFVPCAAEEGTYLYQVKPGTAVTLRGSCNDGQTWKAEATVDEGFCQRIEAGNGNRVVNHTLQAGDFFLADGHLLSKDADAAEVAAADVIGIVFQTDPERIGQADKQALGGTVHGQVIATREITPRTQNDPMKWSTVNRDESSIGLKPIPDASADLATNVRLADEAIDGYYYTTQILTQRAEEMEKGQYPLFTQIEAFAGVANGPRAECRTTGWYLPAIGQWFDVIRNLAGYDLDPESPELTQTGLGCFYWGNSQGYDIPAALNRAMAKVASGNKTEYETKSAIPFNTSSIINNEACHCLYLSSPFEIGNQEYALPRINILAGAKKMLYQTRPFLTF